MTWPNTSFNSFALLHSKIIINSLFNFHSKANISHIAINNILFYFHLLVKAKDVSDKNGQRVNMNKKETAQFVACAGETIALLMPNLQFNGMFWALLYLWNCHQIHLMCASIFHYRKSFFCWNLLLFHFTRCSHSLIIVINHGYRWYCE